MTRSPRPRVRPTPFGASYTVLFMLSLLGCVNYDLSLGYGLTFLLASVWVVAALRARKAARGLRAVLEAPPLARAGGEAAYALHLEALDRAVPVSVVARTSQGDTRYFNARVPAGGRRTLALGLPARARGELGLEYVHVAVLDEFALWQAGVDLPVGAPVPVAPAPEPGAPPMPTRRLPLVGEGETRGPGDEDFAGLRAYVPGDSPRQVSWKHVARRGELLTRETDAPRSGAALLRWADTADARDAEHRLSRLAAWVERVKQRGEPFALELPGGETVAPGAGEAAVGAALARALPPPPVPQAREGRSSPAPGLEVRAVRATLLALAVALLPGVLRQPVWVTVLGAGLLLHTAWRTGRGARPLPTLLLGAAAGVAAALLWGQYGTLLGRDAGTALLALLVTLKAAESRTRRDANLLVLLGLFVIGTHYFFGQGPLTALHSLLSAGLLLYAATRWTVPLSPGEAPPPAGPGLRAAARALLLAAPLAAALFVLFPRPVGPLWQFALQDQATTGLANEISAGEYSNLAQNRAVAFRADFQGAPPPPAERYWRGPVYEAYDGVRWTQVRLAGPPPSVEWTGPARRYALTLEPSASPWLPVLEVPSVIPEGAFVTSAFQAILLRPAATRRRIELEWRPARSGVREDPARLQYDLALPGGQSPRARALGESWRPLEPQARVRAGLAYLRDGGFRYTLNPPTLPAQNRVDAFLYTSRLGFCEHYASAFAFLMRAAGVPARIVGGYQGGEANPDGGYLTVRQQDAHAWTEVWLAGQGWVRVDPTALIAPARVNAGLDTALVNPQATAAAPPGPLQTWQLRLDALQNRWNDAVVGYDDARQQALLGRAGLGGVGAPAYLLALVLVPLLALLPALLGRRRAPRPADAAERALGGLARQLGTPRGPGETATAYLARVAAARPHLAPLLDEVRAAYHAARYGDGGAESRRAHLAALERAARRAARARGRRSMDR